MSLPSHSGMAQPACPCLVSKRLSVDLVTSEASDQDFLNMIDKDEVLLYRNP